MNDLEERLRDAYRAAGQTVRPETVRSLRVTGVRRARERPRWAGVLLPLGAAAAVAALVIAAALIVPKLADGHGGVAAGAHGGRAQAAAAPLPEFTVAADHGTLHVFRTATGQEVGQVAAPAGQELTNVTGAAGDRTFLVTADLNPHTHCQAFLYKVQVSESGQPSPLAPLAVSGQTGVLPTAVALSADGRTAALATVRCAGERPGHIGMTQAIGGISLLDMPAGHVTRQWSFTLGDDYPSVMSLSSDGGKLAFPTFLNGSLATVTRVLSTSAPAGPVDSASRIVLREPHGGWAGEDATALSPDGRTLYACSHAGSFPAHSSQTIAAYDATTGRQIRVFRTEQTTELSCGLTMDPAGGYLLYTSLTGKAAKTPIKGHPGFLTTGHTTTVTSAVNLATGRFSPLPIRIPGALYTQGVAW